MKKKKWIRKRHQIVRNIVGATFGAYAKRKYRITVTKFDKPKGVPYLILYNHQTAYDQFFVGLAFREHLYYVASEDIFSMGALSRLIKFLVEPIPIKKQTADPRAVINCIKVAKEGGSIAIAPEGNRTFSGKTEYIKPSIVGLAKHLGLPIAFFRIEGGYGVHPRWSNTVRSGGMRAGVSKVIYPETYKALSDDELYEIICRELYQNEACCDREYHGKALAEYVERAVYVCPDCGLSEFRSYRDTVKCLRCKKKVRYLPTKELEGVGFDFPFRFISEWYDYQSSFINSLDLDALSEEALYTEEASFHRVLPYDKKQTVYKTAKISLYKDKITVRSESDERIYTFDDLSAVTVLGKNKINLYIGKDIFQISGNERLCALKYVNLYNRYNNLNKGDKNAEFLGL